MIKTRKFNLTKKEYFSFLIRIFLKRRWWLFAIIYVMTFMILFKDEKDSSDDFFIVFGVLYPLIILLQYWRFANSKENKNFYVEQHYEISANKIINYFEETSESTFAIENFIKVLELKDVYMLYVSKTQSMYFPKRIFESKEDENWFRNEIFLKIKNK